MIPTSELAFRLINEYHASKLLNHTAITSTYKIWNNKYYIKNLLSLITDFVKGCVPCNMNKDIPGQGKSFDFHLSMSKGERAMQCVYLDLKSMYTDPFNNNYLMVCVCSRTKYIMAEPIKDRSAKEIISKLLKIFSQFGFCEVLYSDLEGSINSALFKAFLSFLKIEIKFCSSQGHASHGVVERAVSRISSRLVHLLACKAEHWSSLVQLACLSANSIIHNHGYSPFYLMFGRSPHPVNSNIETNIKFDVPLNEQEYIENLQERFREANEIAKEIEFIHKKKQRAAHRNHVKDIKGLRPLDLVYLYAPKSAVYLQTRALKFRSVSVGPLCVESIQHQRQFRLRTLDNLKLISEFHTNRITPAVLNVSGQKVTSLISLIKAIKQYGIKNKDAVIQKLEATKRAILEINKMTEPEIEEVEVIRDMNDYSCMIVGEEEEYIESEIIKGRWKEGELYLLVNTEKPKFNQWLHISEFPSDTMEKVKKAKIRITGSILKYRKQMLLD